MDYGIELKDARMRAVRDAIAGGLLEIGTAGMKTVLVSIPVGTGDVRGGVLTAPVSEAVAQQDGDAASARIRGRSGDIAVDLMTAAKEGAGANVSLATARIGAGAVITVTSLTLRHG